MAQALTQADLATAGKADSFLKASHVKRTRHARHVTPSALSILLHNAHDTYLCEESEPIPFDEPAQKIQTTPKAYLLYQSQVNRSHSTHRSSTVAAHDTGCIPRWTWVGTGTCLRTPELPSPEACGWRKSSTQRWAPLWTFLPEGVASRSELLRCGRQKACRVLRKCEINVAVLVQWQLRSQRRQLGVTVSK